MAARRSTCGRLLLGLAVFSTTRLSGECTVRTGSWLDYAEDVFSELLAVVADPAHGVFYGKEVRSECLRARTARPACWDAPA